MADANKIYPRTGDNQTVYLKNVITDESISVGDYTMYNDFVNNPTDFQKNNVLYHYPINKDKLTIGKFCSIACGAKFIFTSANHTKKSLSTYPFPLFFEEWNLNISDVTDAWDNKGDITLGNDVWIGANATILPSVSHIADGAVIGAGSVVVKNVPPFAIVAGNPSKIIKYRFKDETIRKLVQSGWWDRDIESIRENPIEFAEFTRTWEGHEREETD